MFIGWTGITAEGLCSAHYRATPELLTVVKIEREGVGEIAAGVDGGWQVWDQPAGNPDNTSKSCILRRLALLRARVPLVSPLLGEGGDGECRESGGYWL